MGARIVEHNKELAGNQIDVYVEIEGPDHSLHRIAVETKDLTRTVGLGVVNDFAIVTLLLQSKRLIHEGVIVGTAGFSKEARNAADSHGIRLLEVSELDHLATNAEAERNNRRFEATSAEISQAINVVESSQQAGEFEAEIHLMRSKTDELEQLVSELTSTLKQARDRETQLFVLNMLRKLGQSNRESWPRVVPRDPAASEAEGVPQEATNSRMLILGKMLEGVNAVTSKKLESYRRFIEDRREDSPPLDLAINPAAQVDSLLENIQLVLARIFDIERHRFGLSILYTHASRPDWSRLASMNVADDMDVSVLIGNPSTTARQIIDGKERSIFFPDKRTAVQQNQYVPDLRDKSFNTIGSVFCSDVSIGKTERHVQAVLSVTTYGKQLCAEDDYEAIDRIKNMIMQPFEEFLKTELALLYIKEHLCARDFEGSAPIEG